VGVFNGKEVPDIKCKVLGNKDSKPPQKTELVLDKSNLVEFDEILEGIKNESYTKIVDVRPVE
jgi:hypothetical protein